MSALLVSGIIFILTAGGILLGALLRRTLPKHHLNEHARDVVRLGVGLIAAIAALVLGLLIGAAKSSFETQNTHRRRAFISDDAAGHRSHNVAEQSCTRSSGFGPYAGTNAFLKSLLPALQEGVCYGLGIEGDWKQFKGQVKEKWAV
jgi:hypothetical protein